MNTNIPYPERAAPGQSSRPPNGTSIASPANFVTREPVVSKPIAGRAGPEPVVRPGVSDRHCGVRRLLFRSIRVVLTGAVLAGAGTYARHVVVSATSDQAYINGEMTVLRAPIEGQLQLETMQPGAFIAQNAPLFRIQNTRFGNQEVNGQLNWVRELTERLHAEADEAAVRCQQQLQVYRRYEKLHLDKLISDLEFIDEQTKLALAQSVLTNKQVQARQADSRAHELETQVELQKEASIRMPFNGVVWAAPAKPGAQVSAHEPVLQLIDPRRIWIDAFFHEKHAKKLRPGAVVRIHAIDGEETWTGRVESIRAGVGRIAYDNFAAALPGEYGRRRVAVRVAMESKNPFDATQFFGVGRSVVVSIANHE